MGNLRVIEWEAGSQALRRKVAEIFGQPGFSEWKTRLVALVLPQVERHQLDFLATQGVFQHLGLLIQLVQAIGVEVHNHLDAKHADVVLLNLLALPVQLDHLVPQTGDVPVAPLLGLQVQLSLELGNFIGQFVHGGAFVHRIDVDGHVQVTIVVIQAVSPADGNVLGKSGQQEAPDIFRADTQVIECLAPE